MKLFIDGGASNGIITEGFMRRVQNEIENWEFILFEPTKIHEDILTKKFQHLSNVHYIPKAIWIKNSTITLNTYSKNYESNNIIPQKPNTKDRCGNPLTESYDVECIDFAEWVESVYTKYDYRILKLDIECAEFQVLRKMIDRDMIDIFDEYWIEFHSRFDIPRLRPIKNQIIKEIEKHGKLFKAMR